MNDDTGRWADELITKGVIVLEGVAGIGKTYSIREAREHIFSSQLRFVPASSWWHVLYALVRDGHLTLEKVTEAQQQSPLDYGRTILSDIKCASGVTTIKLVMHPSTSYEDFIGGMRPSTTPFKRFEWQQGAFLTFLDSAISHPYRPHLFVMDEINRCNLPSVLGELMYLIEPSRRVAAHGQPHTLTAAESLLNRCDAIRIGADGHLRSPAMSLFGNIYWIPDNVFILGTMNSSDRSILGFDQALRRRFPPQRLEPFGNGRFEYYLRENGDHQSHQEAKAIFDTAAEQFTSLNALLRFLIGPDAMIGHSYLLHSLHQAKYKQVFGNGKGFDGVHPGRLRDRIAAAWRYGILPQVVHAVESARQPELAVLLCGDLRSERCRDKTAFDKRLEESDLQATVLNCLYSDASSGDDEGSHNLLTRRYEEALEAAGLADTLKKYRDDKDRKLRLVRSFTSVLRSATESTCELSPHGIAKIVLVGQGHGCRLLIIDEPPAATGGASNQRQGDAAVDNDALEEHDGNPA